jgi:hypothetical protein
MSTFPDNAPKARKSLTTATVVFAPGDVFLTRGTGFLSKLIRFFTRTIGEERTKVNHVGVVVDGGDLETCVVVEALLRVCEHKLWSQYGPPKRDKVAVYRPINLTPNQIESVVAEAREQVGKKYGILKLLGHLLDWLLLGAYVFRRITRNGNYPICSWLVAHAFAEVGKDFGVHPGAANPDDIWDFAQEHREAYELIHPLQCIWTPGDT